MNRHAFSTVIMATIVAGSLLLAPQITFAANIRLDRSIAGNTAANIRRAHPAPVNIDLSNYIDTENSKLHYEDESLSLDVIPVFDYISLVQPNGRSAHVSDYDNALYMYGQNHNILSIGGAAAKFQNKTNETMVIDINSSSISVGSFKGKIMLPGTQFVAEQTSNYAPLVIPPNGSAQAIFFRSDYFLAQPGMLASWTHPVDTIFFGENVMGNGEWALNVNGRYIMPTFDARLSKDKMSSFIKTK